jgi:hypothetical protein
MFPLKLLRGQLFPSPAFPNKNKTAEESSKLPRDGFHKSVFNKCFGLLAAGYSQSWIFSLILDFLIPKV